MTLYAPRSAPRSTGTVAIGSRIPLWAVERLEGYGDGPNATFLATAVRNAYKGGGDQGVFHKHVRTVWEEAIMLPLMRSRNELHLELRGALGAYTSAARATDMLARCLPMTARLEEGTPAREHLDAAIGYLEAAAAVEAVIDPPNKGQKQMRQAAALEWTQTVNRHLGDAQDGLRHAFREAGPEVRFTAPRPMPEPSGRVSPMRRLPVPASGNGDVRPMAVYPTPNADAAPLPMLDTTWETHVRPAVSELLKGGHGLWHSGTKVTVSEGRARIDVTLSREATQVRVSLQYGPEGEIPAVSYAMGAPGEFRERDVEEVHRTLHEGRDDPASIRLVSEIQRTTPGAGTDFSISGSGSRAVRLSPIRASGDSAPFLALLARVEDLAEERGVKVEVGVDGLAVRVTSLVERGYEWSGRKGETVMARKAAPAHVLSIGR